jgi:hypothetical protein
MSGYYINFWSTVIEHCSWIFNARALDINMGDASNMVFSASLKNLIFHDNSGDGTKACINITPLNWSGEFKNILIENNGQSTDRAALSIGTYGTGGLSIERIWFGDGNPPVWDALLGFGTTTTIRHIRVWKGIGLYGRAVVLASALFAIYPYANHELKFIPDPDEGVSIKFLDYNTQAPTDADALPGTVMWIDFNDAVRHPVTVTTTQSPYTLKYTDVLVFVDASGGNVTINIPSKYAYIRGTIWTIKRIDSTTNTVTINYGTLSTTLSAGQIIRITGSGSDNVFYIL